jgi:glycosyltransferase involved in cell wall biosynthesis
MKIVAVVLTSNDSKHLQRCLSSLRGVAHETLVVDCYSTDDTNSIAREYRARIVHRDWDNYASQFNWGLSQIADDCDWILRLDADEYLTSELAATIQNRLPRLDDSVHGAFLRRRVVFQGQEIRFGGRAVTRSLRLVRHRFGQCGGTHRDPQVEVPGPTVELDGDIIQENMNSLSWWIHHQSDMASLEAVDRLVEKYPPGSGNEGPGSFASQAPSTTFPSAFGALGRFTYRYLLRGGFLDGGAGAAFHLLSNLCYPYLVDAKVTEVERVIMKRNCNAVDAINAVLRVDIRPAPAPADDHEELAEQVAV